MGSNKLKEIDIENCTCYYFDDIIESVMSVSIGIFQTKT